MQKELDPKLNERQTLAYRYLCDKCTTTIMYGGAAGGGKTWLAAFWMWNLMNSYKDLNFGVCRKEIKDSYQAFASTFAKLVVHYGDDLKRYKMTQEGIINLKTRSRIEYVALYDLPSDPDFQRLGGHEYSSIFVDECSECSFKAIEAIRSRNGRQKNEEYGLKAKVLLCSNPAPGWLYTDYYLKRDDFVFNLDSKVILASSKDNIKYLPQDYLESLSSLTDPILRRRLVDGDWETSNQTEANVIPYSSIVACLQTPQEDGPIRMGVDVGGHQGYSDKTIVQLIRGNVILDPIVIKATDYSGPPFGYDKWLGDKIIEIAMENGIEHWQDVRIDASGIGQPVYAYIRSQGLGVYAFRGDAKPLPRRFGSSAQQYLNLRTQAFYELKEKFRLQKIKLPAVYNDTLIQELTAVRYSVSGSKLALEDKKFTRRRLGHSPDYADGLAMSCIELGVYSGTETTTKVKPQKSTMAAAVL